MVTKQRTISNQIVSINKQPDSLNWRKCRMEIIKKILPYSQFNYLNYGEDLMNENCECGDDTCIEFSDLCNLSLPAQEKNFVKDLLLVLAGFEVKSIKWSVMKYSIRWRVNPSTDECFRNQLNGEGCLPLAAQVILLRRNLKSICSDLMNGTIALRLCRMIDEYMQSKFMPIISRLSRHCNHDVSSLLTLADISSNLREFRNTFCTLNDILIQILQSKLIGGEILSCMKDQRRKCVWPYVDLILESFEKALLADYIKSVFLWTHFGTVFEDFTHDFMVWDLEATNLFTRSQILENRLETVDCIDLGYLDKRFCEIEALCPTHFAAVSKEIIVCGKYLNMAEQVYSNKSLIREGYHGNTEALEDWQKMDIDDVISAIRITCETESRNLVFLLKKHYALDDLYGSFRYFLLLECCDWVETFIDLARESLSSHSSKFVAFKKLNVLFEEAVHLSALKDNKYRSIFKLCFDNVDVFTLLLRISRGDNEEDQNRPSVKHSLYQLINLRVDATPPLTVIFSPKVLHNYSLIFRTIFALHYSCYVLNVKQSCTDLLIAEYCLIENMLHFLNAYITHCCFYVTSPQWDRFMCGYTKSVNVEEIMCHQDAFFKSVLASLFLPDIDFVSALSAILSIIIEYSNNVIKFDEASLKWNDSLCGLNRILSRPNENPAYSDLLLRIFSKFL